MAAIALISRRIVMEFIAFVDLFSNFGYWLLITLGKHCHFHVRILLESLNCPSSVCCFSS